jgi:biopolymer transport protein TolR
MGMSGGSKSGELNSEINVTPMVDVMLVLLIIFMVTAPMLNTGVDLELPQGQATITEADKGKLILSIDAKGDVYLGETKVPWAELGDKIAGNEKIKTDGELYIQADKNLRYEVVVQAMALAQKSGVKKLMMMIEPVDAPGTPEAPAQ